MTTFRTLCLSRSRLVLSSRRFFSEIPTRHSRHAAPPACLDPQQLKDVTQEILETSPGKLIPYEVSKRDDSMRAWDVADEAVQKVEWLIRGYSAQVKGTKVQALHQIDSVENPDNSIDGIQRLLKRLEKEGIMYMELRRKMRSQIAAEKQQEEDVNSTDEVEEKDEKSERFPDVFTAPGQTIAMFDTLLDTMSQAPNQNTPHGVGELMLQIQQRFVDDGGPSFNVNPSTVPTLKTYNAGLRAIANAPIGSDKTRDDAMLYSFGTFEAMRKRNAATFAYMIQIVSKFVPPSEISGNVSFAMFQLAIENQVIDTNIMRAMELIDCGGPYEKFDQFIQEKIRGKDARDCPPVWRKFGKSLRYDRDDDTY